MCVPSLLYREGDVKVSKPGQAQASVPDSVASTLPWMDVKGENREGSA